jgi:phosphatidylserine/phosphatidylglycerophosphate/cardiolipin synthase-like enzyme
MKIVPAVLFLMFCLCPLEGLPHIPLHADALLNRAINKSSDDGDCHSHKLFYPGSVAILPEDGRQIFFEAFAAARKAIRIEICVLEDPQILRSLRHAIRRGVDVQVIADRRKYEAMADERANLSHYIVKAGGKLHLSNPIFPRSFPKVILIDDRYALIGSACLDTTTFNQYRDYVYVTDVPALINTMAKLFANDWRYSSKPGHPCPPFNPTPAISNPHIIVAPVNAADRLVSLILKARKTLDCTTELLGNPTLESALFSAVSKGVRVRLIAPEIVNGATPEEQALQESSLTALKGAGVDVHVTRLPESAHFPYMHARMAIVDRKIAYLGSISLSPDSSTFNRGVGLFLDDKPFVKRLHSQFESDFFTKSAE